MSECKRMKNTNWYLLAVLCAQLLNGCTLDQLKGAGYQALYEHQCMQDEGVPDCDPEHLSYDEYKRLRDAELKGERFDR
jgi:hypothetical protein